MSNFKVDNPFPNWILVTDCRLRDLDLKKISSGITGMFSSKKYSSHVTPESRLLGTKIERGGLR